MSIPPANHPDPNSWFTEARMGNSYLSQLSGNSGLLTQTTRVMRARVPRPMKVRQLDKIPYRFELD